MSMIQKIKDLINGSESKCGGSRFICPDNVKEMITAMDEIATNDNEAAITKETALVLRQICSWMEVMMHDNDIIKGEKLRSLGADLYALRTDLAQYNNNFEEVVKRLIEIESTQESIQKELMTLKISINTLKKAKKQTKSNE